MAYTPEQAIEELEQALKITCEREAATTVRYDARIEALEARIAKADALAEVAERAIRLSQEHDSFKLYAMEPMWQALAAYREGSDT